MALSTAVSYIAGLGFLKWDDDPYRRKLCLIIPVTFDLLLLAVFKYANFTLSNFESLSQALGWQLAVPHYDIVLPVGISFYTFHTITYIVDCHRRVITPTRDVFEFSCYVSLFSQLVAGPIVRFREIEKDLEHIGHPDRDGLLGRGWSMFAIGMIKKVLIADTIATIIDPALRDWRALDTPGAWLCSLGYAYQLYFDFSGYSDMAVGLGMMFGLRLPQNFNSPYQALGIGDFWRRWHISLSSVLRDYLYIPLGGNRFGEFQTHRNLIVTMLLGGLWHGAGWTFIVWGGYHGALLSVERLLGKRTLLPAQFQKAGTFLLILIGWVFFRAENFEMAWGILGRMFVNFHIGTAIPSAATLVPMLLIAGGFSHFGPNTFQLKHDWDVRQSLGWAVLFAVCVLIVYGGKPSPFLYFQF